MKAAVLLLTLASVMHSSAFGEEPSTGPIFISSGISWDSSRNQFIISLASGTRIFVVEAGATHVAQAKDSIKKFLGMKAVRGCKAQAFHLGTSMLWRVEIISNYYSQSAGNNYLVGYDLKVVINLFCHHTLGR